MKRCSWCNRLMIPYPGNHFSEGGTMHQRCADYVDRITTETQQQYAQPQQETYEMFLARLEDEDGGW